MCVWRRSHDSEVSGRIEGIIGTDRRDRRDARDRTDRKKLKNGRGLGYNWKLGNWEFEIGKLKIDFQGKLKIRWIYPDGWLADVASFRKCLGIEAKFCQ